MYTGPIGDEIYTSRINEAELFPFIGLCDNPGLGDIVTMTGTSSTLTANAGEIRYTITSNSGSVVYKIRKTLSTMIAYRPLKHLRWGPISRWFWQEIVGCPLDYQLILRH